MAGGILGMFNPQLEGEGIALPIIDGLAFDTVHLAAVTEQEFEIRITPDFVKSNFSSIFKGLLK